MSEKKSDKTPDKTQSAADPAVAANGAAADENQTDSENGAGDADESGWGKGELEELRAQNADLKDKLLRVVAEMENLRRRTERDKADTARYAISNFARDVLSIADNIQRAIDHVPEEAADKDPALKSFREGIQVTERELLNVMERHGIARLDPSGERFDPNKHQAMFEVENTDVPEGTIVQVVQSGYVIADRVLRPAMVGVAKGGQKPAKAEQSETVISEAAQAANENTPPPDPEGGEAPPPKDKKKVGGKVDKSA